VHDPSPGLSPPSDFAAFMRQYQDMVFTTAARLLGDDSQAEDIAQETFVRAHAHFAMLAASPTAGGWLKTVATRLCLNHLQRYRRRWRFFSELRAEGEPDGPPADFPGAEAALGAVDADERRRAVDQALARLPARERVPLVLYHFQDLSYEEISRQLGVSLAKVKSDIRRGRAALAGILARSGFSAEGLR
jgi:RNA polymerase sigma-70 factor, ECF subfamily